MLEHSLTIQWLVASGVIHIGGFPSPQIILEDAQPDVDHLPRQMPSTGVGEHCARVQTGATLLYQLLLNDSFFLVLKTFLPALRGHHVLVHSDNITVVALINHQGHGLMSLSLYSSGRQQAARGRSQIILIAAGSEIDLSWQQQLLTIRVRERSAE